MSQKTRDELAAEGMELVNWQSHQFHNLPRGMNIDDLQSAGGEAVTEALVKYDEASGVSFKTFCRTLVRSRMLDAIKAGRRYESKAGQLQVTSADGSTAALPADKKALDPAAVAERRDGAKRRVTTRVQDIAKTMPGPDEVAQRVVELRSAMFSSISAGDVSAVMGAIVQRAKSGDLKAAGMLFDLLSPDTSGVQVQTVVVQSTEVGE